MPCAAESIGNFGKQGSKLVFHLDAAVLIVPTEFGQYPLRFGAQPYLLRQLQKCMHVLTCSCAGYLKIFLHVYMFCIVWPLYPH